MTAGGVRDVDMAEGIAKVFDRVTDAAFIDLHVVDIIEDFQLRRANQADHLRGVRCIFQVVADMVSSDVQSFQVHLDSALFRKCGALLEVAEHGAGLHRVGQVLIGIDHDPAVAKAVRMDSHTGSAQELCRLHGLFQVFHIGLCLLRVDQGQVCVTVETADRDSSLFSCLFDSIQILLRPSPEFNGIKTVILGSLESFQEGDLTI